MRIVHFLHRIRLSDGGVVRATLDLCNAMAARGHDVTLATFDPADVPDTWTLGATPLGNTPSVEVLDAPVGPLKLFSNTASKRVAELVGRADMVHIHEFWQPSAASFGLAAKNAGTPYVVSAHGMLNNWAMEQSKLKKRIFLQVVGNRMFKGAAKVHCAAQGEAKQARRWVPGDKTAVVPILCDLDLYRNLPDRAAARRSLELAPDTRCLVFLGRVHPQKGIEHLIDAAAQIRTRGLPVEILVAGTGDPAYAASLKEHAESMGLGAAFRMLGMVTGAAKAALLRAADALVLPSYQENFGLVLVEAMACGTPVVTSRAVDIWRELQASNGAIIVEAPRADLLADATYALVADERMREAMGTAGRKWVFENLSPDRVMDEFDAMYRRAQVSVGRRPLLNTEPASVNAFPASV